MALDITVTDDYRITSDSMNIIVNKRFIVDPTKSPNWEKRKKEGASPEPREEWRELTYHNTIEEAMNKIVNQKVLESNARTVSELLHEIKQIRREISAVLPV